MDKEISINDIFKAAMQVEVIGEAYYLKYAEITDQPEIRKTFTFLATREKTHLKTFQDLLETLRPEEAQKGISAPNRSYFNKTINEIIFNERRSAKNLLSQVKDLKAALKLALELEYDSIDFYKNILQEVRPEVGKEIGKIITEEEIHVETVAGMLENIP